MKPRPLTQLARDVMAASGCIRGGRTQYDEVGRLAFAIVCVFAAFGIIIYATFFGGGK